MYIADTGNGAIRIIQDGFVSTLMRMDGTSTYPSSPRGLLVDGDTLYVGDVFSRVILTCDTQKEPVTFTDVGDGAWYAQAVQFVVSNDLFTGTSDEYFSPNAPMTRAMALTVMARWDGVDTSPGNTWYAAGQEWAVENGISDGSNLEDTITREQLAVMLYRHAQSQGEEFSGLWMVTLDYPDANQVSDYAYEAMCWMTMKGIITDMGNGTLNPQGEASRAEAAAIMFRFYTCAW